MHDLVSRLRQPTGGSVSRLSGRQRITVELFSGLLILSGLLALIWFAVQVNADSNIQTVMDWSAQEQGEARPSLVLAFLDSFGIVLPVLILLAAVWLIRLGWQLRTCDIGAARWAQLTFMWLALGFGGIAVLNVLSNGLTDQSTAVLLALLAVFALRLVSAFSRWRMGNLDSEQWWYITFTWWIAAYPVVLLVLFIVTGELAANLVLGLVGIVFAGVLLGLSRVRDALFAGQEPLHARQTRTAWNLLVPTLLVLIVVAARPLEQTFINSLTDKRFASSSVPNFTGLDNYRKLLTFRIDEVNCRTDPDTQECLTAPNGSTRWETIDRPLLESGYRTAWNLQIPLVQASDRSLAISGQDRDWLEAMWVTIRFVVGSVSLELLIGLFMALTVNSGFRGRGFMRAVMLVPWAIPTVISARLWELMLKDTTAGIINRLLMDVNLLDRPSAWLAQPDLQIPSAILIDVWKTSPFMALLLLAGLQTIPTDLYEAAAVDGANKVRQFFNITLPLLRPTIAVALVFRTLDALRVFDLFNVLYGRQQLTMATYNYEMLVNNQKDGYASAVGVLIFFFIFIFAVMYVRILKVDTE